MHAGHCTGINSLYKFKRVMQGNKNYLVGSVGHSFTLNQGIVAEDITY